MSNADRYRIYMVDRLSRLAGYHAFAAQSDWQAREVGHTVFKACNDECTSAEIWKGHQRIAKFGSDDGGRLDNFPVAGSSAELAIQIAETLASSNWAIARSKRLHTILGTARIPMTPAPR